MAVTVLYTRWDRWTEEMEEGLYRILPEERQKRLPKGEKRCQVMAAYGLFHFGLAQEYHIKGIPPLCYGKYGKPMMKNLCCTKGGGELHFNMSHTDGLAVCAFSSVPVGVDAERIRTVAQERAQRLDLPDEAGAFYAQWVERESRIKARGGHMLQCRHKVTPCGEEVYLPLFVGQEYSAGVCTVCHSGTVRLHGVLLPAILHFI